jgi:hypothetical protein
MVATACWTYGVMAGMNDTCGATDKSIFFEPDINHFDIAIWSRGSAMSGREFAFDMQGNEHRGWAVYKVLLQYSIPFTSECSYVFITIGNTELLGY